MLVNNLSVLAPTTARRPLAVALIGLACPALLVAPAAAEPQPWHNPEYVAAMSATTQPNKAQIEYLERLATTQPNKAQIEYRERLATTQPNKAQIEYLERLATAQPNKAQIEYRERQAMSPAE